MLKKYFRLIFITIALAYTVQPAQANPVFGYTHLLPSPLTIPAGRLVFGTEFAFGVTDFLQVGTNVLRDFYKVFNANAKLSLIDLDDFALSPTFAWETFNYRDISEFNPDLRVTSWMPGLVASLALDESVAWFLGGNLNITKTRLLSAGIVTSGFVRGATIGSDLSWAYNLSSGSAKKKGEATRKRSNNVLSAGVDYDINFKRFGVGISHHWPGFHLGVHYYPGATKYPLLPILAGGGAIDF